MGFCENLSKLTEGCRMSDIVCCMEPAAYNLIMRAMHPTQIALIVSQLAGGEINDMPGFESFIVQTNRFFNEYGPQRERVIENFKEHAQECREHKKDYVWGLYFAARGSEMPGKSFLDKIRRFDFMNYWRLKK